MQPYSAESITGLLTTRTLGRTLRFLASTGSTNTVAHAEAEAGAPDGLAVVADEQTAGRGRMDRSWWAPAGTCLLFSLLLRPQLRASRVGELTMCLGLGAVEGIAACTGVQARLKWPNDLVLAGRKLGGMLAETRLDGERIVYAVLGLGVNVNLDFARDPGVPAELSATAGSLQAALGRQVDRALLLAAILLHTERRLLCALEGERPLAAWADALDTLGQEVTVTTTAASYRGIAAGVTLEGALRLALEGGGEQIIWSGDVTAVRPLSSPLRSPGRQAPEG